MHQQTSADGSFEKFRKKTRKEQFLDEMEVIIPWQDLTKRLSRSILSLKAPDGAPSASNGCCASTFSSTGSTCPIRR